MDLITLIGNLETNLTREIVYGKTGYNDLVSYTNINSTSTVVINSTTYTGVNRLCLLSKNSTTYLYISNYDFKKKTKINISTINSITIT